MLHDPYFITVARKKPSKKVPLVSLCKRKLNAAQHTLAYKLAALHAFGDAIVTEMPLASNNPPKKSHFPAPLNLLPLKDAILLTEFLSKYPSATLTDALFPDAFKSLAYIELIKLVHLLRSHTILEIWGPMHKFIQDQIAMVCWFYFQGEWLSDLSTRLDQPLLECSLEELNSLVDTKLTLNEENSIIR